MIRQSIKYCSSCGSTATYRVPEGDNRERAICDACGEVHYRNPLVVVGCVPERNGRVLLCKRAIEPRHGKWTLPAGFMELGETVAGGAARETLEEALATVELGHLFAMVDVIDAGQVHLFYTATLVGDFGAGAETLEADLFNEDEIPWDEIAFESVKFALRKFFEDRVSNNRDVHVHELRRSHH
jgi:ADP-ribose pyrophosphatase YjhB (NUDIX family)